MVGPDGLVELGLGFDLDQRREQDAPATGPPLEHKKTDEHPARPFS